MPVRGARLAATARGCDAGSESGFGHVGMGHTD
jgi:hypothetical protein